MDVKLDVIFPTSTRTQLQSQCGPLLQGALSPSRFTEQRCNPSFAHLSLLLHRPFTAYYEAAKVSSSTALLLRLYLLE